MRGSSSSACAVSREIRPAWACWREGGETVARGCRGLGRGRQETREGRAEGAKGGDKKILHQTLLIIHLLECVSPLFYRGDVDIC